MKMMMPLVFLLLGAARLSAVSAESIESFAKGLLARVDEQYWWGIKEDKPPGGYLFKFEYDITGDGRREIFLASSLEEDEGTYAWTIYSPNAQQNYTTIASGVVIPPVHGFYFKANGSQRELQTVYRNQRYGLGVIDRYAVSASGKVTHEKQELSAEQITELDTDNWKERFGIGSEVKLSISKILLAEYARNPSVQWRAYKEERGVTGQNEDPADASAIAANDSFTIQDAKRLLDIP